MGQKKVSNQFTVNTVEDGQSAPYYFQEWYAWSNDSSTASVTTEPNIAGTWAESIPAQGSYAYLWRKSIRYVLNSGSNTYTPETAQYFRMSGTNGTSITPKGNALAYTDQDASEVVPNPTNGDIVLYVGSSHDDNLDKYDIYDWSTMAGSWEGYAATDGDSYVMPNGHLMMYSSEAHDWIDLGQFQGQSGKTYYTHIAWATNVIISGGVVTSVEGFVTTKSPNDTTHIWMGVLIDENSGQDSTKATTYTWSNTKGDGAAVAHASTEQISIPCNSNGSVSSQMTVTVSFSMRIGSVAASNIRVNNPSSLPTGVQYSGIYQSSGRIIISTNATASGMASGLTFAVIGSNGTKDYTSTVTIALIGVKQGNTGERGNVGRFYYYAGDWDATNSTTLFVINDAQAPFFSKAGSSLNAYYVYNPDDNPSGGEMTMAQMAQATSSGRVINWNNKPWEVMTNDFKYLITEALFAGFAKLGSFIISGDWMLTHYGVIYDTSGNAHTIDRNNSWTSGGTEYTPNNAYLLFDASYPNSSKPSALNFCPSFCVDGLTGETYQQNAHIKGEIEATSGTIGGFEISNTYIRSTDTNHNIQFNNNGNAKMGVFSVSTTETRVTGILTIGSTNQQRTISINPSNSFGSSIVGMDGNTEMFNLSFSIDGIGEYHPSFKMSNSNNDKTVEIKENQIHYHSDVTDEYNAVFGSYYKDNQKYGICCMKGSSSVAMNNVCFGIDMDGMAYVRAFSDSGSSLWPTVNTSTQTPSLNKGKAYVMTLAQLRSLLNNYAYNLNWFNNVSLMVVQTS